MSVVASAAQLRLQAGLQARLGPEAAVVCTGVDGDPQALWPQEREAIARAVLRRRREFAAGRSAARAAMQRLNWPASAIPANADRSPGWPHGLVGSIAHSADTCLAVVGRRNPWVSIGIDIEPDQGIDASLWEIICRSEELRPWGDWDHANMAARVARVFVAKEAFYKWHFAQHRQFIDFQDVSVRWAPNGSDFEVVLNLPRGNEGVTGRGQLFCMEGRVVAVLASRADGL